MTIVSVGRMSHFRLNKAARQVQVRGIDSDATQPLEQGNSADTLTLAI